MRLLGLLDLFRTRTFIPTKTRSYNADAHQVLKDIEVRVNELSSITQRLGESTAQLSKSIEESCKP